MGRAGGGAERAKDAAISWFRFQQPMTGAAFVKPQAGIDGHSQFLAVTASGAGKHRFGDDCIHWQFLSVNYASQGQGAATRLSQVQTVVLQQRLLPRKRLESIIPASKSPVALPRLHRCRWFLPA